MFDIKRPLIWALAFFFGLTACRPLTPAPRPDPQGDLPARFSLYQGPADPGRPWWQSFGDPELDRLVRSALTDNFSVREAWARLNQVEAAARQAGAVRLPVLSAGAEALSGRRKSEAMASGVAFEDYSLGLAASYELDFWGRLRALHTAAQLQVSAARQDLHTAATTVAAEVVNRWLGIVGQRMQRRLLNEQVNANRILLELVELRFQQGMASVVDVYQQRQVLESVQAEIPLVKEAERLLHHELALLLGRPAAVVRDLDSERLPEIASLPATGLPADLLAARPDVISAGLRLQAADWQVAAARANRLPALRLNAQGSYGDGGLEVLFDNWVLTLAANLTMPLFDGGQRAAEVVRLQAVADEDLLGYRAAVLGAVKEVEDALVAETHQLEHLHALQRVTGTARLALEEAKARYRSGITDYLPVLTQVLTVQNLERGLIHRQASLLGARVRLFRALGGTWPEELLPARADNRP